MVEIRAAKKHELYTCIPCNNKIFKRIDNFRRHLRSSLHARRKAQYDAAKANEKAKADETAEEIENPIVQTEVIDQERPRMDI